MVLASSGFYAPRVAIILYPIFIDINFRSVIIGAYVGG